MNLEVQEEEDILERKLQKNPKDMQTINMLIGIARNKKDTVKELELLERKLKLRPKNMRTIARMINIVREKGDRDKEKELLERILVIDPSDIKALSSLINIAREEGNKRKEKQLLERQLELEPNNLIVLSSLIRIATERGDLFTRKELLERQLAISPDNERIIKNLMSTERQLENMVEYKKELDKNEEQKIEDAMLQNQEKETPVQRARKMIYDSQDKIGELENIKELLEEETGENREFVLAELYFSSGLMERAQKLLGKYKKSLDPDKDKVQVKLVKKALSLAMSKKTRKFDWDEFWEAKEKFEQAVEEIKEIHSIGESKDNTENANPSTLLAPSAPTDVGGDER